MIEACLLRERRAHVARFDPPAEYLPLNDP